MKYLFFLLLALCHVCPSFSQTYTVETVPNTKLVNNSYVSNPDNIITPGTVAEIDSVLTTLESNATAQVAVVLLNSIGEADIFEFSQELFNKWGIGQASNDNGLLILMVLDQRTVRFHTGDGIEGILPDALCKQIQREKMVPYFKEGNYDAAMIEGVREVARVLNNPESFAENSNAENPGEETHLAYLTFWIIAAWVIICSISFFVKLNQKKFAGNEAPGEIPKGQFTGMQWFLWFIVFAIVLMIGLTLTNNAFIFFGGLYAYGALTLVLRKNLMDGQASKSLLKKQFQSAYNYYQDNLTTYQVLRYVFPIPIAFMYGAYKKKMLFFRNYPRDCSQCGKPLSKLDEQGDDKYLNKGQLLEEELKSVDYDVWICNNCQSAETFIYRNPDAKYTVCPKCTFVAFHLVSHRTLRSATENSTGLSEEVKACKQCGHRTVTKHTIPKITRSSSSGSSFGSSSSGGSWGGGRSSGGGASSSW